MGLYSVSSKWCSGFKEVVGGLWGAAPWTLKALNQAASCKDNLDGREARANLMKLLGRLSSRARGTTFGILKPGAAQVVGAFVPHPTRAFPRLHPDWIGCERFGTHSLQQQVVGFHGFCAEENAHRFSSTGISLLHSSQPSDWKDLVVRLPVQLGLSLPLPCVVASIMGLRW